MSTYGDVRTPGDRLRSLFKNNQKLLNEAPTRKSLPLVHPFPAPMSLPLAESIVRETTDAKHVVLDPMAGSGIVPAAARALGRKCCVTDIDPLALLSIRVQCGAHSGARVAAAGERVLARALELRKDTKRLAKLFETTFDEPTRRFINDWFPLRARRGLLALWSAIEASPDSQCRLPLKIAFSRVIIAKTAGASYAIDLPHTRPHRDPDKEVPDPLEMFPRRVRELELRLALRPDLDVKAKLGIRQGDVRRIPYADKTADLVLTSSPYANAIDYMRAHKFSLVWMGYSVTHLQGIRSRMIGAERGLLKSEPHLEWLERMLPEPRPETRARVAVFRRFFHDMEAALKEIRRVLKPGGACVFVLGKSILSGDVVDTPAIITRLAEQLGFDHVGTICRDVNPHRRSLPFPRGGGSLDSLGKRMAQETVVGLAR